ncbi:MAG: DRTGG domain-containing protein [Hyphomicrobiales bacterium]
MKISELAEKLNLTVLGGHDGLDREIEGAYVSDLLSDVMGHARAGELWITLQTHKNVSAIASLKDLCGIILVKNFKPDEDMLEKCNEDDIPVLQTNLPTFELSGKVYAAINNL